MLRWQNNKPFVAWLLEHDYAYIDPKGRKAVSRLGEGLTLYCHEAWQGALAHASTEGEQPGRRHTTKSKNKQAKDKDK